jgi:hypothetical protein
LPFVLGQEREHVIKALTANGHPQKFLTEVEKKRDLRQQKTPSPKELVRVYPSTKVAYAVLPYIKRLLKPYNIQATTKPIHTLEQMLPSPKDMTTIPRQTNVIYRINCAECSWSYIGETGQGAERSSYGKKNM